MHFLCLINPSSGLHLSFPFAYISCHSSSSCSYQQQRIDRAPKMAKIFGIFACFVIIALDIVAGILGIKAEAAQNQEKHLKLFIFECKEPSHDAYVMGLAAIILLGMAHVLANLLAGCSVCATDELQKPSSNRLLSVACLILTWLVLAVGMALLVIGTLSNNKSRASCGFSHHHFFSIGGILCIVHGLISVAYYVTSTTDQLTP